MTVTSFDVVFYALAFIVPGFIWSAVIGGFVPRRADQKEVVFLRFLTFSCMNYAFWSWLIYLIIKRNLAETYLFVTAFLRISTIRSCTGSGGRGIAALESWLGPRRGIFVPVACVLA